MSEPTKQSSVEIWDSIQVLTRALWVAEVSVVSLTTGTATKWISSSGDVVANYKKLYAALVTEHPEIKMAAKIQILTRAISAVQVTKDDIHAGYAIKTTPSIDDAISTYKELSAAMFDQKIRTGIVPWLVRLLGRDSGHKLP